MTKQIVAVADGRMHFEAFRGRAGNLFVRKDDGTREPLVWYDRSYWKTEDDMDFADVPPEREGPQYQFHRETFRRILEERFATHERLHFLMLINSFGGSVGAELFVKEIADFVKERGGDVSAYATTVAVSAGSAAMMQANDIHLLEDTLCMWHLPHFPADLLKETHERYGDKAEETIERWNRRRHDIHAEKLQQLIEHALPEKQEAVRAAVEGVMSAHGVRHELRYTGRQLQELSVVSTAFQDMASLKTTVQERFGFATDDRNRMTDPVSRFFCLSRIEEHIRRMLQAFPGQFKILMQPDGTWQWQSAEFPKKVVRPEMFQDATALVEAELQKISEGNACI